MMVDGVFRIPFQPKPGFYTRRLLRFKKRFLAAARATCVGPVSREGFSQLYTGPKRVLYAEAAASLKEDPVKPSDAFLTSFVKAEKLKDDKAPRIIQPRSPRYNVEVGRYLKPNDKILKAAIGAAWRGVTCVSGYNAKQVAGIARKKYDSIPGCLMVDLDASRFDQGVSESALRWEHSLYQAIFRSPELQKLLSWQITNKGTFYDRDLKISYSIRGGRMSGDMNTSLGNCVLMSALVFAWCEDVGMHPGKDCHLLNNGDDCVLFIAPKHRHLLPGIKDWFIDMGMRMKVGSLTTIFERMDFCQCRPVWATSVGWVMVRNPLTCLSKDVISIKGCNDAKSWAHARSQIAGCGLALATGVPIMQQFYSHLDGGTGAVAALDSGMAYLAQGLEARFVSPSARTRASFFLAYGITPRHQEVLELSISRAPKPTYQATWPMSWRTPYQSLSELKPLTTHAV